MCGRYRLSRRKEIIEEYFETADWQDDWSPRYNIAPTQPVPVIRQHPKKPVRELALMKWGLIPNWAKDPSIATGTIKAKSETAATKPAFRDPLKLRRCLIPSDGFYEWRRTSTSKQPFCFEVNNGELFRATTLVSQAQTFCSMKRACTFVIFVEELITVNVGNSEELRFGSSPRHSKINLKARGRPTMPVLNGLQDRAFYRVRIKEGHSAAGLLVSATGKRCIPSTQYWLTLDSGAAYRFPRSAALHVQVQLGKMGFNTALEEIQD